MATVIALRPWRCATCDLRFYAWRVAVVFSRYAHCPRCGNFDLQEISRVRVAQGFLRGVKRLFGMPAYRCDPCRLRFFSMRPRRRILPSTSPASYERPAG